MYFINPHTVWISNSVQAPFFTIFLALSNIWPLVDSQACCGNAAANQVSRTKRKLMLPPCRPRSSACRPSCKLLRRGTRWRWPGGKTRRSVRTNFCRLSWTKYRCYQNKDTLVWTFKLRRSWTRTYTSVFTLRASLPNKIREKNGRQFHHTGKKGRVHNWHATPFPLRTI